MRNKNSKSMKRKINFNLKVVRPKKPEINFLLGKYKNDLKLTWPQAKRKYPLMKPHSDSDFDGTLNRRDCRPLNPAKDGIFGAIAGAIKGAVSGSGAKEGWREGMAKGKAPSGNGSYSDKQGDKSGRTSTLSSEDRDLIKRENLKEKWRMKEKAEQGQLARAKKFRAENPETISGHARLKAGRLTRRVMGISPKSGIISGAAKKVVAISRKGYKYASSEGMQAKVRQARTSAERLAGTDVTSKKGERKQARPGRPAGVYKHISPITGKPVPATIFYRHIKRVKRGQRAVSERVDTSQAAVLARRGIPPEVARQIINRRQLAREGYVSEEEQQQPVQAMPTQPIQNGTPMQEEVQQEVAQVPEGYHVMPNGSLMRNEDHQVPQLKYRVVRDIMTGRTRMVPIPQKERWVQQ